MRGSSPASSATGEKRARSRAARARGAAQRTSASNPTSSPAAERHDRLVARRGTRAAPPRAAARSRAAAVPLRPWCIVRVEHRAAVAAGRLGAVHREVGVPQRRRRPIVCCAELTAMPMLGRREDLLRRRADRRREPPWPGCARPHAPRRSARGCPRARTVELVAAEAAPAWVLASGGRSRPIATGGSRASSRRTVRRQALGRPRCSSWSPAGVAEAVVHRLEAIEIDEQDREERSRDCAVAHGDRAAAAAPGTACGSAAA